MSIVKRAKALESYQNAPYNNNQLIEMDGVLTLIQDGKVLTRVTELYDFPITKELDGSIVYNSFINALSDGSIESANEYASVLYAYQYMENKRMQKRDEERFKSSDDR